MANRVFIANSLDGFISDRDGGLDWLHSIPNPDGIDFGYAEFVEQVDAVLMGRTTFETVCGFDCDWPYTIPVFVLSNSLTSLPDEYAEKAELVRGPLSEIVSDLNGRGYLHLYVDGGKTIQSFLAEDLIDEMTITVIPVLLGGGSCLFGETPELLSFDHVQTEVLLGSMVQSRYRRKR